MDLNLIQSPEDGSWQYAMVFYSDEAAVVSSAYREHVNAAIEQGETPYKDEARVASFENQYASLEVKDIPPGNLCNVLKKFADRTEEVTNELIGGVGNSALSFLYSGPALRYHLGKTAEDIIEEIQEKVVKDFTDEIDDAIPTAGTHPTYVEGHYGLEQRPPGFRPPRPNLAN